MSEILTFIREHPVQAIFSVVSGIGIIYVAWKLLSAIAKYCLAKPRMFFLGVVVILGSFSYRAYQLKPLFENMSGHYENKLFTINLSQDEEQLTGSLTTSNNTYPVEGVLTSLGEFNGHYLDSDKKYPLSIIHPMSNLFSMETTLSANLEAAGRAFELDRQLAEIDLSGIWSSLQAKLQVQKTEENENNNWQALFKTTSGIKSILTFNIIGDAIEGTYRNKDKQQKFFSGKYLSKNSQIKINIDNNVYLFTKGEIASYNQIIQQYTGAYQGKNTTLWLTVRGQYNPYSETWLHVCDGLIKSNSVNSSILKCGVDSRGFVFDYHLNDHFAQAHMIPTESGFNLELEKAPSELINPIYFPLLAGRYVTKSGTIISLEKLEGDIWTGKFIDRKNDESFRFKGKFAANNLEGIYINKSGNRNAFVLVSKTTHGTLTFKGKKTFPFTLLSHDPVQPHSAEDLKIINKLVPLADVQLAKVQNIVQLAKTQDIIQLAKTQDIVQLAKTQDIVQLAKTQDIVPLQLYWSSQRGDNFVTATHSGKNDAIAAGYRYVRDEACIFSLQKSDTIAFNLYWSSERGDNFTTATNKGASDARAAGYSFVRTEGYIYSTKKPGTIPINLYWSSEKGNNFTTATYKGASNTGAARYSFVRTEGYAYPASKCK
jgi:hypothetical protein